MSIPRRLAALFRNRRKALDRAEDPREVLDYSYTRQLEMLQAAQARPGPLQPPGRRQPAGPAGVPAAAGH